MATASEPTAELARLVTDVSGLRLLLLMRSRTTGEQHARSDWDFGYLADERFDPTALHAQLVRHLGTEDVDLVDLAGAGALLRYRAARDGTVVLESRTGAYEDFWLEAVDFWCDAGALIDAEYRAALARLT